MGRQETQPYSQVTRLAVLTRLHGPTRRVGTVQETIARLQFFILTYRPECYCGLTAIGFYGLKEIAGG